MPRHTHKTNAQRVANSMRLGTYTPSRVMSTIIMPTVMPASPRTLVTTTIRRSPTSVSRITTVISPKSTKVIKVASPVGSPRATLAVMPRVRRVPTATQVRVAAAKKVYGARNRSKAKLHKKVLSLSSLASSPSSKSIKSVKSFKSLPGYSSFYPVPKSRSSSMSSDSLNKKSSSMSSKSSKSSKSGNVLFPFSPIEMRRQSPHTKAVLQRSRKALRLAKKVLNNTK